MQSADGQTISKLGVCRKSGVVQAFHLRSFGVEFFARVWAVLPTVNPITFLDSVRGREVAASAVHASPPKISIQHSLIGVIDQHIVLHCTGFSRYLLSIFEKPAHLVCGRAATAPARREPSDPIRGHDESSPAPTDSDHCKARRTIH